MTVTKDAAAAAPAYDYHRAVWHLGCKQGLVSNGKRVLRVLRERGRLAHDFPERLSDMRRSSQGRP
jgi:hypothetical protein